MIYIYMYSRGDAPGEQYGDPRKIPNNAATPAKSRLFLGKVHMATLRTIQGQTGQVVIRHGCLHHTIHHTPVCLHLPLCVYITTCTSHRLRHTVYIMPMSLPTGPQPVPVATLRTSHVSRERAAWHSARCVIYIRIYMHL